MEKKIVIDYQEYLDLNREIEDLKKFKEETLNNKFLVKAHTELKDKYSEHTITDYYKEYYFTYDEVIEDLTNINSNLIKEINSLKVKGNQDTPPISEEPKMRIINQNEVEGVEGQVKKKKRWNIFNI